MDFSLIDLDDEQRALQQEIRAYLAELFTPDVFKEEHETGSGFNTRVYEGLGKRGWLFPELPVEQGGAGFTPLQQKIMGIEIARQDARVMMMRGVTSLPMSAVRKHMRADVADPILKACAEGKAVMCLGYSEPDGGSDIANAKVRAVQDGDMWTINGSKMWTTGAHVSTYTFLVTRTDPDAPKHKGITMFLVPLDTPGVTIQGIRTFSGERTNIVYYEDVQLHDRYRLGGVNDGWSVLHGPLDAEHSIGIDMSEGLTDPSVGVGFARVLGESINEVAEWAHKTVSPDGRSMAEDTRVRERLGAAMVDFEAGLSTPGPMGRVRASDALVKQSAILQDLLGPAGLLPMDEEGSVGKGDAEYAHRFAQGTGTYGGTVEVFRTIIAQHVLGLPKASYPGSKVFLAGKKKS
ncbi:MAG: acyl-CoA dehydrogenase family protein [Actinomycetota bacterium]|nr:acyl-CoA dehydrogenase family protein [Actinomycetota bacterium]